MREYGGFFSLPMGESSCFSKIPDNQIIELNSARNAIALAIKDLSPLCVWLPLYTCKSVYETLEKESIPYRSYNIDEKRWNVCLSSHTDS